MIRPARRWYWSAWRSTPAERTGMPSSVKPAAPASASSAISVSPSPRCPTVTAAMKPTGMRASSRARSRSERSTGAESTTGSVFGWAMIAQKPPAAPARLPESMSSSSSRPGVRRCTCGSTKAGKACRPSPSTSSAPSGASSESPSSATLPWRTSRSARASMPARGSSSRAPRTSTVAGGVWVRSRPGAVLMPAAAPSRPRARRPGLRARRAARRAPPCGPRRRTPPAR